MARDPSLPSAASREKLALAGTIALKGVEGRLDHLAFDPQTQRLFIAGLENHSIEVVDLGKRRRIHEIIGVNEPQGLVCVPEKRRLLVCSRGDGTCRSFDVDDFQEGPWIDLGRNADNIRFDPGSNTVFAGAGGEPGNGSLIAIDLASLLPTVRGGRPSPPRSSADLLLDRPRQGDPRMEISLPSHPESFQLDPAHGRIFANVPDEHKIFVVNVTGNGLTTAETWPVTIGEKNFPMAFDGASCRLFVACRKPARLAVYEVSSGVLLSRAPCVGDADDLFFDPAFRRVYVIGGDGFVDLFDVKETGKDLVPLGHVPTAARARTGLFIPESRMLVIAAPHTDMGPARLLLFKAKP
jgi:hypothetical protein